VLGDEERDRQHVKYKEQKKQKTSGRFVQQKLVSLAEALVGVTKLLTIIVMNLVTLSLT
jgi:hypothetical protein